MNESAELAAREAELKRAEEALGRLATFPEQNPNPVIETDLAGKVTYLNPVARARFPDLSTAGLAHPMLNDLESIIGSLEEGEEESNLRELEVEGHVYEQKTTYMASNNLVRIYAYDITELKRAEEALRRLATFPEQNPNPVIETDLGGKVTYINPVAQERFPDLSAAGLQHPMLDGLEAIIRSLEEGEEESYLRELEVEGHIYEQKTTYMASNNLVRIYAHDITQLKKLQKQLQDSLTELEKTNRELQETQVQLVQSEKMAAMANLVAGIAHEINTPIGAMSSVHDTLGRAAEKLKVLLEESLSTDSRGRSRADAILRVVADSADVIRNGSERVSTVMQSLKNFARLDEAELNKVDIHSGLDDTLRLVQHDLGDRIEVIRNYGEVPPIVCYPGRLNQVFLCFLVNAIEAIEGTGRITLTTSKEGDKLHVTVQDTGIGISDENLEKIFEPGFTTKGVGVGSGLGLSICYQIMRDHNGEILVQSKPGEGAAFTAVLSYDFSGFLLR